MSVVVVSSSSSVDVESRSYSIGVETGIISGVEYSGEYDITPTMEEQVLPTTGKTLSRDVVIGAIPNNYGLITWDGSTLMVS